MKGVAIRWEWLRAVLRIEARDVDVVLSRYVAEQLPDFDLCLGWTLSRDLFVVSLLDDVGKPIQGRLYPGMELSQSLCVCEAEIPTQRDVTAPRIIPGCLSKFDVVKSGLSDVATLISTNIYLELKVGETAYSRV